MSTTVADPEITNNVQVPSVVVRSYDAMIEQVLEGERAVIARVASQEIDRFSTVITPSGIDLSFFNQRSPVFLFEHGISALRGTLPVGRGWAKYRKHEDDVISKCIFRDDSFSRDLFEFYKDRTMTGWSVRVLPNVNLCTPPTRSEIQVRPELVNCNVIYRASELAEISATSVGGNRDAISLLVSRGFLTPDEAARTMNESTLPSGGALVKPEYKDDDKEECKGKSHVSLASSYLNPADTPAEPYVKVSADEPTGDQPPAAKTPEEPPAAFTPTPAPVKVNEIDQEDATNPDITAPSRKRTIKKVGSEYVIFSEKGKRLGRYKSKDQARKRLQQIEYFKHQDSGRSVMSPDQESYPDQDKVAKQELLQRDVLIEETESYPDPDVDPHCEEDDSSKNATVTKQLTPVRTMPYIDTDEGAWYVRRPDGSPVVHYSNAADAEAALHALANPRPFEDIYAAMVHQQRTALHEAKEYVIALRDLYLRGVV
jgi:hypothetical protein